LGAGLTTPASRGILGLAERIAALHPEHRRIGERLYDVRVATARTDPPPELESWLADRFGSVEAVRDQQLVHVTNLATLDAAVFAPLRARRPIDGMGSPAEDETRLREEIAATEGDPFCHPENGTPASAFGRIRGVHTVTGANAGAGDEHHGVIVFDRHDPLAVDIDLVRDVLVTGRAWADGARATSPAARSYLLIWNCLWRAGGSIVHGHAQVLLGSGRAPGHLARWRRDAAAYRRATGSGLVDDMVDLHRALGLAIDLPGGMVVLAHLTPIKERELLVIGQRSNDEREPAFGEALGSTLIAYRDVIGVRAFNLALWRPPLDNTANGDLELPPMVRLVDRGRPFERSSDIGAMELYGSPIVSADPFDTAAQLRTALA
jgi:hypothetical protein